MSDGDDAMRDAVRNEARRCRNWNNWSLLIRMTTRNEVIFERTVILKCFGDSDWLQLARGPARQVGRESRNGIAQRSLLGANQHTAAPSACPRVHIFE